MNYKSETVSNQSSFSYVNRCISFARQESEVEGGLKKTGNGLVNLVLFAALFLGIVTAVGFGISKLGADRAHVSAATIQSNVAHR